MHPAVMQPSDSMLAGQMHTSALFFSGCDAPAVVNQNSRIMQYSSRCCMASCSPRPSHEVHAYLRLRLWAISEGCHCVTLITSQAGTLRRVSLALCDGAAKYNQPELGGKPQAVCKSRGPPHHLTRCSACGKHQSCDGSCSPTERPPLAKHWQAEPAAGPATPSL